MTTGAGAGRPSAMSFNMTSTPFSPSARCALVKGKADDMMGKRVGDVCGSLAILGRMSLSRCESRAKGGNIVNLLAPPFMVVHRPPTLEDIHLQSDVSPSYSVYYQGLTRVQRTGRQGEVVCLRILMYGRQVASWCGHSRALRRSCLRTQE